MKLRTRAIDHLALARLTDQGLDPLRARLFASRGVRNRDDCDLSIEPVVLPPRMMGLEAAAERVAEAIIAGAAIVVVGDYDCDGATGVACAVRLRAPGATIDYLVPSRFADGYGLSPRVVDAAAEHPRVGRAALIVTVDNGIGAIAGVEHANALGIPVIVERRSSPARPGAAGGGGDRRSEPGRLPVPGQVDRRGWSDVTFVVAVRARLRALGRFAAGSSRKEPALAALLDLVALGTVADIVALDQNNRRFIAAGLGRPAAAGRGRASRRCSRSPAARRGGGPRRPRLPDRPAGQCRRAAAGGHVARHRMPAGAGRGRGSADGRTTRSPQPRERRDPSRPMENAGPKAATIDCPPDRRTLVVFDAVGDHGVIGLVASRIKDRHHRPCIALAPEAAGDYGGPLPDRAVRSRGSTFATSSTSSTAAIRACCNGSAATRWPRV